MALGENMYSIRPMRAGDQSAIEAIFEAGMRYYSDPLPTGSVLKRSWERYIQNALASDLADIQGVYFAGGGHFWSVEDVQTGVVLCFTEILRAATSCLRSRPTPTPRACRSRSFPALGRRG